MVKNLISRVGVIVALALALSALASAPPAHAQWFEDTYPGFYSLQTPGLLQATLFGGGYVSDKYGVLQEGVQVEQSVTPYVGVFGRATGYQLWIGNGFESPLAPGSGKFSASQLRALPGRSRFHAMHRYSSLCLRRPRRRG